MIDFLGLVHRDHHDLELGLDELVHAATISELRGALDGVRLGLTAHAEAEDIVLYRVMTGARLPDFVDELIEQARAEHLAQEGALGALVSTSPFTKAWRERADYLRALVHEHARYEEQRVVPAIRAFAPAVYDVLAGLFATERLRQLGMLQPSAPILIPPAQLEEMQALAG